MEATIFQIILGILIFNFVLSRVLDLLNERLKDPKLPPEAEGIYDEEQYARWLSYDKMRGRLGLVSTTAGFVGILAILWLNGFAHLDAWVRQYTEDPILMALAFFGITGTISSLFALPFSIYATFVIEEKFGFNRTTWRTFWLDRIISAGLLLVIGGSLMSLIVWLWQETGDLFWLIGWGVTGLYMIFTQLIYPYVFLPLFNKMTPLEDGSLRQAIESYCAKVGFKLNNVFVFDGSRRSSKANAFFTGLGPEKKIMLFDTLIEKHTENELVAVLAHEVGHYKKKHTLSFLFFNLIQLGITFFVLSLVLSRAEFSQALGAPLSFHIGVVVFGLLYSPMSLILGLLLNYWSRKNEYEADAYASQTYGAAPLRTALTKISVDQLANLRPHPAYVFFNYSHPPLLQRLAALNSKP